MSDNVRRAKPADWPVNLGAPLRTVLGKLPLGMLLAGLALPLPGCIEQHPNWLGSTDGSGDGASGDAGSTTGSGTTQGGTAGSSGSGGGGTGQTASGSATGGDGTSGGSGTGTSTGSGSTGTDTSIDFPTGHLQNHNGMCSDAKGVACLMNRPGPQEADYVGPNNTAECFTADLTPPFDLVEMRYYVGNVEPDLAEFIIEVRAWDEANGKPGTVLFTTNLDPAVDATVGQHSYAFPAGTTIDATRFCAGIATTSTGTAGGVGISVDDNSALVPDVSWFKGECTTDVQNWGDITMIDPVMPQKGNWCIDVTIE